MTNGDHEPVIHAIEVRCPVAHAFDVFTTRVDLWWPPGHRHLDGARLTMEPRVGGRFFEAGNDGSERDLGTIVQWDPPHRLRYTWHPGAIREPTTVDVSFVPRGEGTYVQITHSEGDAAMGEQWAPRAKGFDRAWTDLLPHYIRHAQLQPAP